VLFVYASVNFLVSKVVNTYNQAFKAINPKRVAGKLSTLWIDFAKFYEENRNLESARTIFVKGTKVPFKTIDELADIWCEYVEMEVRHRCDTIFLQPYLFPDPNFSSVTLKKL
jgi:hypothetical protein